MLTTFRLLGDNDEEKDSSSENWHVLNCHLQAGKNGGRRVRQIVEGISTAFKLAKKLKGEGL
jgi:hypothetical protein